ncbi:MAG: hypothetical protein ACQXXL_08560, partial [Candidatus Methanosuratincola sp.]
MLSDLLFVEVGEFRARRDEPGPRHVLHDHKHRRGTGVAAVAVSEGVITGHEFVNPIAVEVDEPPGDVSAWGVLKVQNLQLIPK